MLAHLRLPAVRLDNASTSFIPVPGARLSFAVIERESVVDLDFSAIYEHAAGSVGPIGEFDLPAVQGQVTVTVPLANDANWHTLPFDQIDMENNTSFLEFNPGANSVSIKKDGLYEIQYIIGLEPSGISNYQFRFEKTGAVVIPGSVMDTQTNQHHVELSTSVIYYFLAGEDITLSYNSGGATGAEVVHATANIIRLASSQVAQAGGEVHLTFEINGTDVASPYTDGLVSHTANTEGQRITLRHRTKLDPGLYNARVMWKTNNPVGTGARIRADGWPADFTVEVRSNPGTLAHGVDAKQHGVY